MTRPSKLALTKRELEVLIHIASGLGNAGIAKHEFISIETVRTHVKSVLQKLRARNRAHAVAIAYRTGVLTVPQTAAEAEKPATTPLHHTGSTVPAWSRLEHRRTDLRLR
ncbi:LuxR C-terminal-related transcriptional regulator [Amycolatopsis sp. NPDC047767]|uniref:response regulator transcription factor n=1 Tax=Amycolatopsis sp. NPDC047767 TaxID=3156765 RepID=UPI0034518A63